MPTRKNSASDPQHTWVWSLTKGEKVWVAIEESLAQTERFTIGFIDQTGPCEFESTPECFIPYEMEVENNWALASADKESHIVSLRFLSPQKYRRLRFACQCKHPDLANYFCRHAVEAAVVSTHIFRTKDECAAFCIEHIAMHFSPLYCDEILKALDEIKARVRGVRKICTEEEEEQGELDFAAAVEKILD